ncbi:MAG TPA: hypothetical protein VFW33_15450 [Gemmataceae bacterium]|nr:hypothetical protein [Gemmataceae bacterium]
MAQTLLARLFGTPRKASRPLRSASLSVEALEDRLTPSGGPGPSGGSGSSGGSGGGHGSSSTQAIVSGSSSGALVTGVSGKTYQLGSLITSLSSGGMSISQLFSGYPIAPGGGPALQNNLATLTDPSTVPWSMQNSTVAIVPVLLTTNMDSGSYTLVMLDPTTGQTYTVNVTMTTPAPSSGGTGSPTATP